MLETNRGRVDYARGPIHPDEALHLLAFDIIYCCSVYGLFDGIHYTMRNGQERKAYLAKIDAARAAAEERAKAEEQVARLEHAEEFFEERLSAGSPIAHKKLWCWEGHRAARQIFDRSGISRKEPFRYAGMA